MYSIPNSSAISDWKGKTIEKILNNDEILSLFEKTDEELENIVYSNIFPYGYIPNTQTKVDLYITIECSVPKMLFRQVWEHPFLTIRLICHQDKMRLNKAGISATRLDYLSMLIDKLLNGTSGWGYGKLSLVSNIEDSLSEKYKYREMIFQGQDLNEEVCGGKNKNR